MPVPSFFPDSVWEGQSPSRPEGLKTFASPDPRDWEQVVAEVQEIETVLQNVSGTADTLTATNKDVVSFNSGTPLATHASGTGLVLAGAADNQHNCVGLSSAAATPAASATVQVDGVFHSTNWTAITGTVTLTPLATYFLSATPGQLTTTPPVTAGQVVQKVGRAVSDTVLEIGLSLVILL